MLKKYKIRKAKNIVNFDESGARVGCARRESIVVPIKVLEMYKASPENRKSVIICKAIYADGSPPPPLFIIIPRIKIIETY
jgi:hypothetical protein